FNGVYGVCKVPTGDKDPKVSEVYKICEVSTDDKNLKVSKDIS
ncbi:11066_t:CDS:2, partial [Rhizophagus irregularis]